MIVKNESDVLARCLESIKDVVDEIIIIDTGSTDNTKEIARKFTDHVYDFEWTDDFSKARNYSFSKATKNYCMWLDADDVVTDENRQQLINLKETLDPETYIVMMKYNISFDEKGNSTFSYYRERLIRNHMRFYWKGAVHEVITPSGLIVYSDIAVSHKKLKAHDPGRNLRIYQNLIAKGRVLEPREQFYYAKELYYNKHYDESIKVLSEFISQKKGWVENSIEACRFLSYCYVAKKEDEAALIALIRSFTFDKPRAEVCCEIGKHFFDKKQYGTAIYWYETATMIEADFTSGAFISIDSYGYVPYLQLCVCYDRLGNREKAIAANEKAGLIKPLSTAYLYNKKYFETHQ